MSRRIDWHLESVGITIQRIDTDQMVKSIYMTDHDVECMFREWVTARFPEEKPSEDERIKKLRIQSLMDQSFAKLRDKLKRLFDSVINDPEKLSMLGAILMGLDITDKQEGG